MLCDVIKTNNYLWRSLLLLYMSIVYLKLFTLYIRIFFSYQSGAFVEAVIMRYDSRKGQYDGKPRPGGPRSTLCVSSQVSRDVYFLFFFAYVLLLILGSMKV